MAKAERNRRAHAGRTEGVRAVVTADDPPGVAGIGVVVEAEEGCGEGTGDQEGGGFHREWIIAEDAGLITGGVFPRRQWGEASPGEPAVPIKYAPIDVAMRHRFRRLTAA